MLRRFIQSSTALRSVGLARPYSHRHTPSTAGSASTATKLSMQLESITEDYFTHAMIMDDVFTELLQKEADPIVVNYLATMVNYQRMQTLRFLDIITHSEIVDPASDVHKRWVGYMAVMGS